MEFKYVIFEVEWGWFGLFGTENAVFRTSLPVSSSGRCQRELLKGIEKAKCDKAYFKSVQERVASYYRGIAVNFSDVPVDILGLGEFTKRILTACRRIKPGETLTYGQIAVKAGSPKGVRAAGNALARNPLPLIIPCHRIIRANGTPGNFSGAGGKKMKEKMLFLEK
ncbi:MAG: MGMT family protein [Planctomycetes bacterium]|nr:MGMT family protein [Planctomycetota bacterium]